MPGAIMKGALAHRPMSQVERPATRQVTVIRAPLSIPVFARIEGFTNTMYAAVRKVVTPATTSVRTSVLCSRR